MILEEEEDVIQNHKTSLDELVESVKDQMNMLNDVDQPGSDIQNYVTNLNYILGKNIRQMMALQQKVESFDTHLKDETVLSNNYYTEKAKFECILSPGTTNPELLDVYDLDAPKDQNEYLDDDLLITDD